MKKRNAMLLPDLIKMREENDVKLVVCTMTIDLLGLQKVELMDGIEYFIVGVYLGEAEKGNMNESIYLKDYIKK